MLIKMRLTTWKSEKKERKEEKLCIGNRGPSTHGKSLPELLKYIVWFDKDKPTKTLNVHNYVNTYISRYITYCIPMYRVQICIPERDLERQINNYD